MILKFYYDDEGQRVYTIKEEAPDGSPTESAHPARFSPDDKFSKYRIIQKKRFKMLLTQQAVKQA